jgi:alpha-methylacyl-CoA racemase
MTQGPLAGVRVLEIAGLGPGPFCGMLLADLGADVVRVDRSGPGTGPVPAEHDLLNRGKRSIALDLKQPAGVETVLALAAKADIFFESFRPGVAERLGIGPSACWERRPQLVYGRMTGWGQDGPLALMAGHDVGYIAPTGALHAIGPAGGAPQIPVNMLGDFGGGSLYLAVGLLAALHEAKISGRGQVVDAAIVDGTAHLTTMLHGLLDAGLWRDERGVNSLDGGAPYYSTYRTSDGEYMAVGALEPAFFGALLLGLDIPADEVVQTDQTAWPALRTRMAEAFALRTQVEWTEVFSSTDACVAPVLGLRDAPRHPHLAARDTYVARGGVVQPAPAPRFSRTRAALGRPPCTPGQHTDEVLTDWLGAPSNGG